MTNKDYKRLTDTGIPTTTSEEVYNRLYELENAIDDGTLVFLPCNIGDKFWWLSRLYDGSVVVKSEEVQAIEITEQGVSIIDMDGAEWCYFSDIYFTKEAAEKALEELKK